MKKLSLFIVSSILFCNTFAQLTHYGNYIYPDAIANDCVRLEPTEMKSVTFTLYDGLDYSYTSEDCGQMFHSDTVLTIIGVAGYVDIHLGFLKSFFVIADTNLHYKVKKELSNTNGACYQEVFFDTAINVKGDYYVVLDMPKPPPFTGYNFQNYDDRISWAELCGMKADTSCSLGNKLKLRSWHTQYPYNTDTSTCVWRQYDSIENPNAYRGFYLFPIFGETDLSLYCIGCDSSNIDTNSSLAIIDIENYTHFFPNPVSENVTIQCSFKIKNLEIFNEQGQKVEECTINGYNYNIDVSNYAKGSYFVKITTKSGITTKKILVR